MRSFLVIASGLVVLGLDLATISGQPNGRSSSESGVESDANSLETIRMRLFQSYLKLRNRNYSEGELAERLELFWRRREMIKESIRNYTEGLTIYSLRDNDYLDLTDKELKGMHGLRVPSEQDLERELVESQSENNAIQESSASGGSPEVDLPETVDWRSSGCIKRPYNQGQCGSCYATATMAAIQAMRCIKQGYTPDLSYQQIVDCATSDNGYWNLGCEGGWPHKALEYLQDSQYVGRSDCYMNIDGQGKCHYNKLSWSCVVNASPTNKNRLQFRILRGEKEMMEAIARTGPIIVTMEASDQFDSYGEGIYDGHDCTGKASDQNHAVLLIGYGTERNTDYWLLKNSWGENWSSEADAIMKIKRNTCSIGRRGWVVTV